MKQTVTARAPASVANVAVGFDVLGFAFDAAADLVTVRPAEADRVLVGASEVPTDAGRNTAAVAAHSLREALGDATRLEITVAKGIPLSAGMGGSAASAVGAVVAVGELFEAGLGAEELLPHALAGEAAAAGAPHADNVVPCLFGGLTATIPGAEPRVTRIPVPDVRCVVVRPELAVETRAARAALSPTLTLAQHVAQSARLATFVAACCSGDLELLGAAMEDVLIEPQRAPLVPGFESAREAARAAGALGCSLAGSGPSVFAWTLPEAADAVRTAIAGALQEAGHATESWTGAVSSEGARVVEVL